METLTQFITPGSIFLLTLASGVWLSNSGKPLNTVIFTIHKLIALGAVVATGLQVAKTLKNMDSQALIIALLILVGICIVVLFATGTLMSLGKLNYAILLNIHKVAPALAAISMVVLVYMLGMQP
jgi:hypothetical protein